MIAIDFECCHSSEYRVPIKLFLVIAVLLLISATVTESYQEPFQNKPKAKVDAFAGTDLPSS